MSSGVLRDKYRVMGNGRVVASNDKARMMKGYVNPLRANSDLSQTSHYNIKSLSVSEVMRIENMITSVKFY